MTTVTKGISRRDLDFRHDGGTLSFGERRRGARARAGNGAGLPGDLRAGGGAVDDGSASGSLVAQPAVGIISGGAAGRVYGVRCSGVDGGVANSARLDRAHMADGRNPGAAGRWTGGLRGWVAAPEVRRGETRLR